MIALLLWSTLGWAAEPQLLDLPDDRLAGLGLGAPTAVAPTPVAATPEVDRAPELRRYPLGDRGERGFVTLLVCPDEAAARIGFDGMLRTAATSWPPAGPPLDGVDQSAGDGAGVLLVRAHNVVLMVRDHQGRSNEVAEQILAALTASAPAP